MVSPTTPRSAQAFQTTSLDSGVNTYNLLNGTNFTSMEEVKAHQLQQREAESKNITQMLTTETPTTQKTDGYFKRFCQGVLLALGLAGGTAANVWAAQRNHQTGDDLLTLGATNKTGRDLAMINALAKK